jgi:hypothetical protein
LIFAKIASKTDWFKNLVLNLLRID